MPKIRKIKYLIQFIIILILFIFFKILGLKYSSYISGKILQFIGPIFRSKDLIKSNILKAFPNLKSHEINKIRSEMWNNYGRILAEYMFIKNFRVSKLNENLVIEGQEILDHIKTNKEPVIFVSGHFNNFELMAMHIEKSGIDLMAIYRPLNNFLLNPIMENIRKKYICKHQIKKGMAGMKSLLKNFKNGRSMALMIDQRVSEGIESHLFKANASTTTIPAQFVKKFNCRIVPIYIERNENIKFTLNIYNPITYSKNDTIEQITQNLNYILEKMIYKKPSQWIWSHNRWK